VSRYPARTPSAASGHVHTRTVGVRPQWVAPLSLVTHSLMVLSGSGAAVQYGARRAIRRSILAALCDVLGANPATAQHQTEPRSSLTGGRRHGGKDSQFTAVLNNRC
jgi:hypothetical protein